MPTTLTIQNNHDSDQAVKIQISNKETELLAPGGNTSIVLDDGDTIMNIERVASEPAPVEEEKDA